MIRKAELLKIKETPSMTVVKNTADWYRLTVQITLQSRRS
jgi:hypothetical protein